MFCGENSSKTKEKKRKKEHGNMCDPIVSVAEFYFVHYFIEKLSV